MSEDQFTTTITSKGQRYTHPLLMRNQVTASAQVLKIAPILAYLVYDGFDEDLGAALVLKRVMAESRKVTASDAFKNLKTFLQACLLSHNNADNKPYVGGTELKKS